MLDEADARVRELGDGWIDRYAAYAWVERHWDFYGEFARYAATRFGTVDFKRLRIHVGLYSTILNNLQSEETRACASERRLPRELLGDPAFNLRRRTYREIYRTLFWIWKEEETPSPDTRCCVIT